MDDTSQRDNIYAAPHDNVGEFIFDKKVVDVFPDMIKRSVPGYSTIIHMIGQMAERYAKADSTCYDLGCSLGAATLAMRHRISVKGRQFVPFVSLFTVSEGRLGVVVTFLAIMELIKESLLEMVQTEAFGPIHVKARGEISE